MHRLLALLALPLLLLACGQPTDGQDGGAKDGGRVFFSADYASTYQEVRNCRSSGDHNLNQIRIVAPPDVAAIYSSRDGGFSPGMVVLKVEYEYGDSDCSGPVKQFTVMQRLADGGSPSTLDWNWQTVSKDRQVVDSNTPVCIGCHRSCGQPPDGFDGTCALP